MSEGSLGLPSRRGTRETLERILHSRYHPYKMKPRSLLAVLLSLSLQGEAFAQSYSAATSAESGAGVSGAAGTVGGVTAVGDLRLSPLSAATLIPGVAPSFQPTAMTAAVTDVAASKAQALVVPTPSKTVVPSAAKTALVPVALKPSVKTAAASKAIVPSALKTALPAAAKKDAAEADSSSNDALFDGLKVYVVREGRPTVETTLDGVAAEVAGEKGVQVRLLTAKGDGSGLTPADDQRVRELLKSRGVDKPVMRESLPVEWTKKEDGRAAGDVKDVKGAWWTWPFREARFLGRAFKASLVKPLPSEIIGGLATKTFPLVTAIGVYWHAVGLAHPFSLVALIALSVSQEVFHGFFLKSWNNFQEILRRSRGFNYQMFFNLAYMQGFGSLYRLLTWTANPASVTPPWTVGYWKDIAFMSVVGTFFGVLGYNSLNQLYAKGAIKRWQHSGIQQLRDLCFLLAAPFFASGSMTVFWGIFFFQQALDLGLALWAGWARPRPIVFVTSSPVAASPEFAEKYPAQGAPATHPLRQAWTALVDNPLVVLATWPARAAWKAWKSRGGKK